MAADFGPCSPWPVHWLTDVSAESAAITGEAVAAATDIVWALSGRQFGTCQVKLRPCRPSCLGNEPWPGGWLPWPGTSAGPGVYGGSGFGFGLVGWWFEPNCGSCRNGCSCNLISEILLPAPVNSIVEVRVDGVVVTGSAYRVDDNRRLIRVDGANWPICNDLNKPDTAVGTWSVTALYGQDVPDSGAWAIGELAGEFIKASKGEDCRLPRNVTSLARAGVTITLPAIGELLKEGRTGLALVDYFIAAFNPNHLRAQSRVHSVDGMLARRAGT